MTAELYLLLGGCALCFVLGVFAGFIAACWAVADSIERGLRDDA